MVRLAVILGSFVIVSCLNTDVEVDDSINYQDLTVLDLELIREIGDSDDYVPVHLFEMIVASDGSIVVSDLRKFTIEQFTPEGEYLGEIARRGNGPGELSSLFLLYSGDDDTFVVRHFGGSNQLDIYTRNENGQYIYSHTILNRQSELISSGRTTTFEMGIIEGSGLIVATTGAIPRDLLVRTEPQYIQQPVVVLDSLFNIVRDSLHMLKKSGPIFRNPSDPVPRMVQVDPPYQFEDHIKFIGNGRYVIARADSSALYLYNENHEHDETVRLHLQPRPVEPSDLEYFIGDWRSASDVYQKLEERVGEFKPLILDFWLSEDHIWVLSDESEAGQEMVAFTWDGNPVGKFTLPEIDDIRHFMNDRIYVLHRNNELGHSIRIYQVRL